MTVYRHHSGEECRLGAGEAACLYENRFPKIILGSSQELKLKPKGQRPVACGLWAQDLLNLWAVRDLAEIEEIAIEQVRWHYVLECLKDNVRTLWLLLFPLADHL